MIGGFDKFVKVGKPCGAINYRRVLALCCGDKIFLGVKVADPPAAG